MHRFSIRIVRVASPALVAIALLLSACGGNAVEDQPPAAKRRTPAAEALDEARIAAGQFKKYAFDIHMDQKVTSDKTEDVKVAMKGMAEREPLKLDQTIHTTIGGESSDVRTVIVPEGYYMYVPEYEEWSKLSAATAADNTKTLSDFQADPGKAVEELLGLAGQATLEEGNGTRTVRYEGTEAEAKTYSMKLLQSTLGLTDTDLDERLKNSMNVSKLQVSVTLDTSAHWPLSYRIESGLSLELEEGKRTTVETTMEGSYDEINKSGAVVLPEEAKGALDPDQIDKELGDDPLGLNEEE
ncbi:DUF6612 family protein [Cohnella sp. GCM10027633]|uniref:DUF6612 family protein n=1 Tax=unclassified Cohnella TaxID=2636738 RepID=UPI003638344C